MKNTLSQHQVIGVPVINSASHMIVKSSSREYHISSLPSAGSSGSKQRIVESVLEKMNKLGKKADDFAQGVREHVRLGSKITKTVKGKLSFGAKIIQVGGVEKVFKQLFNVGDEERLLKASQCYLSTTIGPIAGVLFISTSNVAFCSERSIKLSAPNGKSLRVHYKVLVPLTKIKIVNQSENAKNPSQKYMEVVTVDNFEFWFMGFFNYQKAFKYLQEASSRAHRYSMVSSHISVT